MTEIHKPSLRRQQITGGPKARGGVLKGILTGSALGIIGPFVFQFGSPALTLAGSVLGFFKSKRAPKDEFWRSFTLTCASWFLINGACAAYFVWALSHAYDE